MSSTDVVVTSAVVVGGAVAVPGINWVRLDRVDVGGITEISCWVLQDRDTEGAVGEILPARHVEQYHGFLFQLQPFTPRLSEHLVWNIFRHMLQDNGWSRTCLAPGSILR